MSRVNQEPLSTAEALFELLALFDRPVDFQKKVELFLVEDGMDLSEEATDIDDDSLSQTHLSSNPDQPAMKPFQWSLRYGLRISKDNVSVLWSDLVMALVGEAFPQAARVRALSVSMMPLYGVVSLYVFDPSLNLPVKDRTARKQYLSELLPGNVATVQWKSVFDYSENLKMVQQK